MILVYQLLDYFVPDLEGTLAPTVLTSVGLYLLVDYAWYWNHRLFHAETPLWNLHSTHHKPTHIDVFITARNAFVSHLAMVYLWLIGLATYLLSDMSLFLGMVAFGTIINFWGHTHLNFKSGSLANRLVSVFLVTPRDHTWHHSRENSRCNFGTVLNIWDRLHGTFYSPARSPDAFGDPTLSNAWRQLVWPF